MQIFVYNSDKSALFKTLNDFANVICTVLPMDLENLEMPGKMKW